MMNTIESLVEALVTHLNSIYHSSHHLIFDEEKSGIDMKLVSKDNTSMGQQWGGWYSSNIATLVRHTVWIKHQVRNE